MSFAVARPARLQLSRCRTNFSRVGHEIAESSGVDKDLREPQAHATQVFSTFVEHVA